MRRLFLVRQSGAGALCAALLLASCGRSENKAADDDSTSTSGAGGDAGSGGGGTSGSGGALPSGGAGASPGGSSGAGGSGGAAECASLSDAYEAAFQLARQCDPTAATPQCSQRVGYGLACGEDAFINPSQTAAIAAIQAAAQAYADGGCASAVVQCGAAANPLGANCSSDGECVTVYDNGARGCKVNGVIYAHGDTGIPALDGCNQCSCDDGALACTEIGCGAACSAPLVQGTQCAQCGPTDACQLVEYGCFAACTSSKDCNVGEACISGVCVKGVCG